MALYDIPAVLDFIIEKNSTTNKVIYIGHSQGGTQILAGLTMKLDYYKSRLLSVVGLAPASRVDNHSSAIIKMTDMIELDAKLKSQNIHEILPFQKNKIAIEDLIIRFYPTLNYAMLEIGADEEILANCPERMQVYLYRYPAGTSLKSCMHFKQMFKAKRFQYYDYEEKNKEVYGSDEIPIYDVSKIEGVPIIICAGLKDRLVNFNDTRWLRDELNNTLFSYHEFALMGHGSFIVSNDIVWFNAVLKDIYKILDKQ